MLINRTAPSPSATLAPPGCRLDAASVCDAPAASEGTTSPAAGEPTTSQANLRVLELAVDARREIDGDDGTAGGVDRRHEVLILPGENGAKVEKQPSFFDAAHHARRADAQCLRESIDAHLSRL